MNMSQFQLNGRVALVTGGSKGLGLAMARQLAQAGADVLICSRHAEELKAAHDLIVEGTSQKCQWKVADVSRREDVRDLAQWALNAFGRVDILVNNAGTNKPQAIDAIDDAVWDEVMVDEEGEDEWCWEKDFELTDDAVILPPIEQASVPMFFVCAAGSSGTACSLQGWEPLSELRPHQVCTPTDCHG